MQAIHKRAAPSACAPGPSLIGLAALTRKAMRGEDLASVARSLLLRLADDSRDAAALLDLSTIEQLLGASANRVALQARALELRRAFTQAPSRGGACTLLALVAPGDFMANTPLEFLLEDADIRVDYLYVDAEMDILATAPAHDAAIVAVAECAANRPLLAAIARVAGRWPQPLLNAPEHIARLTRDGAWRLLYEEPGVIYPRNQRFSRRQLSEAGRAENFPFIVRPLESHAGAGLEKIEDKTELAAYLQNHAEAFFYTAPFIDYRGADGKFRKTRIAVVDGEPFPVHLAISSRWMIHYLNADMAENADHRAEEALFMDRFPDFARRHAHTFAFMQKKLQLDYFLVDCAEVGSDQLLIFEVGSAMIAHDLDCPENFAYKSAPMRRLFDAFQRLILSRAGEGGPSGAPA
ncbi:ATP-grasp domain-containing protein [Rhodoblastus sp.]|uniref:ATP-grasp domain-containing protein n=1 Tax=Rhodoblastus sp. TaxID=1962975 RepID=UPI003F966387